MDDVDRLFRQLVTALSDDPERLRGAFEISELYQTLVPYRGFRSTLRFDSIEDYEMAVLRLLAGERGYATVEPPEAQEALRLEADAVNPDTGAFRAFAGALVRLNQRAVAALGRDEEAYAPPEAPSHHRALAEEADGAEEEQTVAASPASPAPSAPSASAPVEAPTSETHCPECHAELPTHRTVVFCPYCALQLVAERCRQCGNEIESGWQYCITCGTRVTD